MKFSKPLLSILLSGVALQSNHTECWTAVSNFSNENPTIFKAILGTVATAAFCTAGHYTLNKIQFNNIHWNWKKINPLVIGEKPIQEIFKNHAKKLAELEEPTAPQNEWLWGTATSSHQVEGHHENSQWCLFEGMPDENGNLQARTLPDGRSALLKGEIIEPAGIACDAFKHLDGDIARMKDLGVNTYRFSIEWSDVIPEQGRVNYAKLEQYKQMCQKLVAAGIKPVITLYHYSEPIWFFNLGGFEHKENISHFVDFCQVVFNELHEYVYLWFTFNAPEGISAEGWLSEMKPPAKKNMDLMVKALYNVLEAHVAVYRALKALPGGEKSKIGILKNIYQLDPWDAANPLDQLGAYFGTDLVDESIYRFFNTGEFYVNIPRGITTTKFMGIPIPTGIKYPIEKQTNEYLKNGGKCLDFVGLNYYCHGYIKKFKPVKETNNEIEPQIPSHDRYTVYGEGLYRAIKTLSEKLARHFDIPIYVTENGIGTDDDDLRNLQAQRYLYALACAINDGFDVRGYIHWSLLDNYEWGKYKRNYGLYSVDRSTPDLTRTKKAGASYFESVIKGSQI